MNKRKLVSSLAGVLVVQVAFGGDVGAQFPDSPPVVQRREPPAGQTVVSYFNGGAITNETRIPGDSTFHTSGQGSRGGGTPTPCRRYQWYDQEANPDAMLDPLTLQWVSRADPTQPSTETRYVSVTQDSTAWNYNEITPSGSWSPETQGMLDDSGLGPGGLGGVTMISTVSLGATYFATQAPLAAATRRFEVRCGVPPAYIGDPGIYGPDGPLLRYQDVAMTDPFWNPLQRLGILWGMIQLPSYRVIAPPEVNTYGGLVVNMPTWLQIEADAWRPYFTEVDEYMGWTSQLGLFPSGLRFEVVGTGGGTIPCAPAESAARGGAIPGAPEDLPRYYELGQLDQDCTWVPQEPGSVTVRARITYDVLLTISGYSEWLSPYVWYSDPLTMSVGELRIRNITPPGGIGG